MKDKTKIEISKIDIKIGDKTISLKPEQAKELKKILNEMFEETVIHEHHHDHYRYWWNGPIYTTPHIYPSIPQWTITCGGTTRTTAYGSISNAPSDVTLCLNQ